MALNSSSTRINASEVWGNGPGEFGLSASSSSGTERDLKTMFALYEILLALSNSGNRERDKWGLRRLNTRLRIKVFNFNGMTNQTNV
jgi:hypothetical protein